MKGDNEINPNINVFRLQFTIESKEECLKVINNYKNNGIKEYEFMAFLDKKTSSQCRNLDGKKLSVEEYQAGVNLPPLHPNCRSCIIPIVE